MKITHIIFSLQIGGTESMLIDIINEQVLYADVTLYIVNNEINYDLLKNIDKKIRIKLFNRKPASKSPLPLLLLNISLLIKKNNVIHCHNYNMISILLPQFRSKAILTIHTTGIDTSFFKKYSKCYAISTAVQQDLLQRKGPTFAVIQNGISFNNIKSKSDFNFKRGEIFRIIQVGRLQHHVKGQNIAIEAVRILKDQGMDNIQIDFIGEGDSLLHLQRLSKDRDVTDHITFIGLKDRSYIYENLRYYDLLIQPSFYEGFGLTIVEAMAAKIPVLVSDIAGPMEIIRDGKYGFNFKCGDASNLAVKIKGIMEMKQELLLNLTEKTFKYATFTYNIKNTVLQYLEEYQTYE